MPGVATTARLGLRSARFRSGRILATVVGAALATAFAVAGFGVAAHLERLVEGDAAAAAAVGLPEGTVVVTAATGDATEPTAISEELVERAGSVPGVLSASGTYEQPIGVRIPRGSQDDRPPILRELIFTSAWDPARWQVVEGVAPTEVDPGAVGALPVALDAGGLAVADAAVGDRVRFETPVGGVRGLVVGRVAATGGVSGGTGGLDDVRVVMDPDVLPRVLGAEGRVDRITVVPRAGVSPDELRTALAEALPDGLELTAATDREALRARAVAAVSDGVTLATWAFAGLSALVAALLVSNTFTIVMAQRTGEIALARCIGLSRRQAVATVVVEAAAVGVVAAVTGFAGGVPLSMLGARVLRPDAEVPVLVTGAMAWAAVAVGFGVTVVAALRPAVRAGRVAPLEAVRESVRTRGRRNLSALLAAPLLGALRVVGGRSRTVRMAADSARRDARRSGATASTLAVGLGLVAAVLVGSASLRRAIDDQFVGATSADVLVQRRGLVRVDAGAVLARMEGEWGLDVVEVTAVEGRLRGPAGSTAEVTASRPDRLARFFDLDPVDAGGGERAAGGRLAGTGEVLLSTEGAERLGVAVGDQVTLRSTSGREAPLRVAGLYRRTAIVGDAVVGRADAATIDADGSTEVVAVDLPAEWGVSADRAARGIERGLRGFHKMRGDTPEGFAELNAGIAGTVTRLLLVLLSGSVLLGGLGAANAVSLSVLERRRELAVLRAVGADRDQVRSLLTAETVMICGIAAVVGLGAGTLLGVAGVGRIPGTFEATPVLPWVGLGLTFAGAICLGVLAARLPTRVAMRRDLLADLSAD